MTIDNSCTETIGWLPGTQVWAWQCQAVEPRGTILMTSGFGEERKCGLRLLTVFGRRLAAAGYRCLRIDFRGVGDSGGKHAEQNLAAWHEDVAAAVAYLRASDSSGTIHGLGVRLGANLLVSASGLASVVAWEPLPSGADYLEELERRRAIKQASGGGGRGAADFDGYQMSEGLRAELRELDLAAQLRQQLDRPVKLIHVTGAKQPFGPWQEVVAAVNPPHEFLLLRQRPFWGRIDTQPREELFVATHNFFTVVDQRGIASRPGSATA